MAFVGHGFVLLFFLAMLAFWGAVVVLIVLAIRYFLRSERSGSALSILEQRFARGEIDQQEYEQRKAALRK
jgi:putative membrane protein